MQPPAELLPRPIHRGVEMASGITTAYAAAARVCVPCLDVAIGVDAHS